MTTKSSKAEYKSPGDPSARPLSPRQSGLLTAEQEVLVMEHLSVVRIIARCLYKRLPEQVEFDDLLSAGVLGLVEASAKFDPSKKTSFHTYAPHRIRGAMLDSLRRLDWFPRALRRNGRAVEQALQTLTAQYGRCPTDLEVADQLEIDLPAYQQLLGKLHGLQIVSLDSRDSEEPDEEELDYISSRPEDDPLFCCLDAERRQRLTNAIKNLAERERMIIALYYYEELTMKEIGNILGIVESRVCQINATTLLHLRALLSAPSTTEESRKEQPPSSAQVRPLRETRHAARTRKYVRPRSVGMAPERRAQVEKKLTEAGFGPTDKR